jgi:hypothetical protein
MFVKKIQSREVSPIFFSLNPLTANCIFLFLEMNNNTGFTPTNTPSTLFPPLESTTDNEQPQQLLWNNVNTFAIPDDSADESSNSSSPPTTNIIYPTGSPAPAALASVKVIPDNAEQESSTGGVFNISWGGTDDKPPSDLHPNEQQEEPIKLSRPLPKPRGVRKLPEPEPSEDGTIDEDTLKRRKVRGLEKASFISWITN